jgi:glycosyltransferase involved in cell wall biosynthesis
VILPNSEAEARQVSRLFGINKDKMHVVYLGVDQRFAESQKSQFIEKYRVDDFVLSVGRIEPRKNQLNLIKAINKSRYRLILIGDPVHGYDEYYNQCKRIAKSGTIFIDRISHEDSLLASAYAACSLFVLPSWFETPGLVALEAGLAGAKLCVTNGGSTHEYFKDYVEYLNPASQQDILASINRAFERLPKAGLKEHIRDNFLWKHAVDENIKAYEKMLR